MSTWSFCRIEDGEFLRATYSGPEAYLIGNTPPSCIAVPGLHDWRRERCVFADDGFGNSTMVVVARKPPRPDGTDLAEWVWDHWADDWQISATQAGRCAELRTARNAELRATDGPSIAALESLLVSVLEALGMQLPADVRLLIDHREKLRAMPSQPGFHLLSVSDVPRYCGAAASAD